MLNRHLFEAELLQNQINTNLPCASTLMRNSTPTHNKHANDRTVVLITAASQGIGRAIATHLAGSSTVVLLARSESIEKIGIELGGLGVRGSVTNEADLKRLVDVTVQRFAGVR
ncbi:MAG: hypothetical protein DME65_06765 [Verrucomicrobia bacterium]|nr:MAG: hypothetical protein DME65_06765 [Verrucomicrobiota bacterium]